MRAPKSQVSSSGKGFNGTNMLDSSINSDASSEAPKARDVIARANGPGMIRALTGSADSATCGCAKAPILRERRLRGSTHFALSALNQTTIAAPGPLGRAITFRAFGAQDNNHASHPPNSTQREENKPGRVSCFRRRFIVKSPAQRACAFFGHKLRLVFSRPVPVGMKVQAAKKIATNSAAHKAMPR